MEQELSNELFICGGVQCENRPRRSGRSAQPVSETGEPEFFGRFRLVR